MNMESLKAQGQDQPLSTRGGMCRSIAAFCMAKSKPLLISLDAHAMWQRSHTPEDDPTSAVDLAVHDLAVVPFEQNLASNDICAPCPVEPLCAVADKHSPLELGMLPTLAAKSR